MSDACDPRPRRLSPGAHRALRRVALGAAIVGLLLGIETLVLHLATDPLADARVYYEAGARLNAGLPLYDVEAGDHAGLYLNPPLLAILFRPLAMLPFQVASAIWQVLIMGAFALAIRRIGLRGIGPLAVSWLALPILWAMSIGQAEPLITLALVLGTPASVAFAGHLKLVPWLAAIYWLARRDWRALAVFAAWLAGIGLFQLVVEPEGTVAYLQLTWLRPAFTVNSISPFVVHPLLWVAMVVALAVLAIRFGRTPYGWPLAVVLGVFAYPRLLVYQLMSLLGALGGPEAVGPAATRPGLTDEQRFPRRPVIEEAGALRRQDLP